MIFKTNYDRKFKFMKIMKIMASAWNLIETNSDTDVSHFHGEMASISTSAKKILK